MLRPATPLSILFAAAFALLLLSSLSTPIIKSIPLGRVNSNGQERSYGVWGYCEEGGECTPIEIGYDMKDGDFTLPEGSRHTITFILVVHPVAAFLALICTGLAIAAHFHSPARSSRYLLILFILTIPTLLVSLLAFLVDILLFIPHVSWGGWIVLGATIAVGVAALITCCMWRAINSRNSRKKRIAENAEMNGQNAYYTPPPIEIPLPKAESPPPMTAGSGTMQSDALPSFATFEKMSLDDKTPLNPRNPSVRSAESENGRPRGPDNMYQRSGPNAGGRGPPNGYGPPQMMNGMPLRPQRSNGAMGQGRGGMGPPPFGRGRGYGPPRYPSRGGYGRGPPGSGMGRGPPPPGWRGFMGSRGRYFMGRGRGRRPPPGGPPPGYDNFYNGPPPPGPMDRQISPPRMDAPMNGTIPESRSVPSRPLLNDQGPIGQAIEMDSRQGLPSPTRATEFGVRDSDSDVQGMLALQQGRSVVVNGVIPSPTSMYTQERESFVPARAAWGTATRSPPPTTSPSQANTSNGPGPTEIPSNPSHSSTYLPSGVPSSTVLGPMGSSSGKLSRHTRNTSSDYYEDVDPRFADGISAPPPLNINTSLANGTASHPDSLLPGGKAQDSTDRLGVLNEPTITRTAPTPDLGVLPSATTVSSHNGGGGLLFDRDNSFESLAEGARSPTASEGSNFTSVSQRGVNPNWPGDGPGGRGGGGGYGNGAYSGPEAYGAARSARRPDLVLEENPDFVIPGARGRGGMRGALRGQGIGLTAGGGAAGRYPGGNAI